MSSVPSSSAASSPKRTVVAPPGEVAPGAVLSVELAEDEQVQWQWSHGTDGQSRITGYQISKRPPPK
jgi:hypothetical protein